MEGERDWQNQGNRNGGARPTGKESATAKVININIHSKGVREKNRIGVTSAFSKSQKTTHQAMFISISNKYTSNMITKYMSNLESLICYCM